MTKVSKIEYIGEELQQCISVDSQDHLYITDENIITMNTIVSGTLSELSFFTDAGFSDEYIFKFFTKLRGRIESRMKGNYFGRFILDSSPNTLESVIDDWVVNTAPKNPQNYIVQGSRWKHVPSDFPADTFDERGNVKPEKAFPVFLGGNGRPPAMISHEETPMYDPGEFIWVPDTIAMRGTFEENVYEALKDQAGIPAGSSDKIFYDTAKIEAIFEPRLKNIYAHIFADSSQTPEGLIWNQLKDQYFVKTLDKYHFWYKPKLPRVFSVDQSISGDVTSIAIAHVERERDPKTDEYKTIYVVDLTVVIAPGGGRVNLDAIRYFIVDLVEKGNMSLIYGSFDQFQSESTMQYLKRRDFAIEKLSVDRTMDPYLNLISIIEGNRLRCGKNIHFKNNLKSLQFQQRRGASGKKDGSRKVDHIKGELILDLGGDVRWETSQIGYFAKDICDSICACVELLRKYNVVPFEEWIPEEIIFKDRAVAKASVTDFLKNAGVGI